MPKGAELFRIMCRNAESKNLTSRSYFHIAFHRSVFVVFCLLFIFGEQTFSLSASLVHLVADECVSIELTLFHCFRLLYSCLSLYTLLFWRINVYIMGCKICFFKTG